MEEFMKNYHHLIHNFDYVVLFVQDGTSKMYKMDVDWDDDYGRNIEYVVLFDEFEPENNTDSPLHVEEGEIKLLFLKYMADDSIVPVELLTRNVPDLSKLVNREEIWKIANEMYGECPDLP